MFYDKHIKDTVEREWPSRVEELREEALAEGNENPKIPKVPSISFRNKVTRRLFESKSPEITEAVEKEQAAREHKAANQDDEDLDDKELRVKKAQGYDQ